MEKREKKKPKKSLGRDPFAGMELDQEETEVAVGETEVERAPEPVVAEVEPVLEQAVTEAEPEVEPPAEAETGEVAVEAESVPEAEDEAATAAEPDDHVEQFLEELLALGAAEVAPTPEAEPVAKLPGTSESAGQLPQDEEASHLLDELIATIDEEIGEVFGPGVMADLTPAAPVGAAGEEQYVIFTLAGTDYAVPITNVTEIGRPLDITPTPNVPDWLLGVANLRGDVISMVDLRAFLGMERVGYGRASRMLVAQSRQEDMTTGLMVDQVSGIRYLAIDQIRAPAAPIEDQVAPYLRGVYEHEGRLLVVLDFERLLLSSEMQQFEPL